MLKTPIVVVCPTGKNRSLFLKEHLSTKGYNAHAIGINDTYIDVARKIRKAKVVICVHSSLEEELLEKFNLSDKVFIKLEVDDKPGADTVPQKKFTGEKWVEFQNEYVYPELKRQIKKYLPLPV